jgi:Rad3-related DNA helicase
MMAFKVRDAVASGPSDPEALLRDLRKKTIPGLLSHQADIIRSYIQGHVEAADVAFQLPTGSGKTLVGLLIGEWRRRKFGERVVYLCPTRQLVNQVVNQATTKYGLDLHAFVGSRANYDAAASADWRSSESLGVTTYSSLFNINPFFEEPHVIILDDAHSAENYIATFWSLLVDRTAHPGAFSALSGLLAPLLPIADRTRFLAEPRADQPDDWAEKFPTPAFHALVPELVPLLDEHTRGSNLKFGWSRLRDSLFACHIYISERAILLRPLIPPSSTHRPFGGARQRLYMSATLGVGGDLERITGRSPIARIPVPIGWDKQGIGRRFFVFPERSLDQREAAEFTREALKLGRRALYLVPDDRSAARVGSTVQRELGVPVFTATELEESKARFVHSERAVAVVANRYDGIDLVDDECRVLVAHGLPRGTNLQERFLIHRVGAQLLLDDRILTRLVQGFGRCTRSANDYAAVVVMGETLNTYLFFPTAESSSIPKCKQNWNSG